MNGNPSSPLRAYHVSWLAIRQAIPARRALAALAFWCAIGLPALYLPLLLAGIESTGGLMTVLALVAGHVATLVGGRHHRAPDPP